MAYQNDIVHDTHLEQLKTAITVVTKARMV
jgi:hypothetical protein